MSTAHALSSMSIGGTKGIVVAGLPTNEYAPLESTNDNIDALVKGYCESDPKMNGVRTLQSLIKQWMPRIRSLAHVTTRKCSDPLFDNAEIETRLIIQVWLSVDAFDPDRGTSLSTWIFHKLNQCAGLLIEGQHKKRNGIQVLDINSSKDNDPDGEGVVTGMELDHVNTVPSDIIIELETVELMSDRVASVMNICDCVEDECECDSELNIFYSIMADNEDSDSDIANVFGIDFAKVGDVRLKAKVALAILCDIKFGTFTKSKQLERLARRVATALGIHDFEGRVRPLL